MPQQCFPNNWVFQLSNWLVSERRDRRNCVYTRNRIQWEYSNWNNWCTTSPKKAKKQEKSWSRRNNKWAAEVRRVEPCTTIGKFSSKNSIPPEDDQWPNSTIIFMFKKGYKTIASSYRRIKLLRTTPKLWTNLITNKINSLIFLEDEQEVGKILHRCRLCSKTDKRQTYQIYEYMLYWS